jgi:hypothetical protein
MPFRECAGRSFNVASIQNNAPASPGVYGLSNAREWLFVEQGNNVREHLLDHLKEVGTVLSAQTPLVLHSSYVRPASASVAAMRSFVNLRLVAINE